jgi:hypothetical protein
VGRMGAEVTGAGKSCVSSSEKERYREFGGYGGAILSILNNGEIKGKGRV